MKKIDLIHTTLLIVAVLLGYSALQQFFYMFTAIVYSTFDSYPGKTGQTLLPYLFIIILFSVAAVLLIRNGHKYAAMLLKAEPEEDAENIIQWQLERKDLLLVLFIGLGVYLLIQSVPYALNGLYDLFKDKVNSYPKVQGRKDNLLIELLRVTIGAFLIYAAPTLTRLIEKTVVTRLTTGS